MVWSISKLFDRKGKKKSMKASDFLKELESDVDYQTAAKKREEKRLADETILRKESKPLTDELKEAGVFADTVWDLVNSPNSYDAAIPVLKEHLNKGYSSEITEGIVRALTISSARGVVNKELLSMFKSTKNDELRWVVGNALATVATEADIAEIKELLSESSYGFSRCMLVHALARLQKRDAIPALTKYLSDSNLVAQSAIALGNLKAKQARQEIQKIRHSDPWVMEQVKEALKKLA